MDIILQNRLWKEFFLKDIFLDIQRGKRLKKDNHKPGKTPYVSSTSQNNGVDGFIGNKDSIRVFSNCLTVANSGSVGATFFHPYRFVASDHVTQLKNSKFDNFTYFFIASLVARLGEKYSFNREINDSRIRREKMMLPVDSNGNPDYAFINSYVENIESERLVKYREFATKKIVELENYTNVENLTDKNWAEFFIEDVATIFSGRDIYEKERVNGDLPYISATANNNGIGYFVGNKNETQEAGCLSVNRNGSVGYSFYHSYNALFSNDCRKLRLKKPSRHIGIFISQQITKQRGKYGYGYKMGTARLKRQKIMLPIDGKGNPDYDFMENYMKRLEYEHLTKYLNYKSIN